MILQLLSKPSRLVATVAFAGLWTATAVNALWLQEGPHPAPLVQQFQWQGQGRGQGQPNGPIGEAAAPAAPRPGQALVSEIQTALAERGFYRGPIDGLYGGGTRAAIETYQRVAGEEVGAEPTAALLARIQLSNLEAPPMPPSAPQDIADLLEPRDSSVQGETQTAGIQTETASTAAAVEADPRIEQIQRVLSELGYAPGPIDGRWGSATSGALGRFQQDRGLPVTGEATDQVIAELSRVSGTELR